MKNKNEPKVTRTSYLRTWNTVGVKIILVKTFDFKPVNVAYILNLNFNVAFGVCIKRSKKFVPFCGETVEIMRKRFGYEINKETCKFSKVLQ